MKYNFPCQSLQHNASVIIASSLWLGEDWSTLLDCNVHIWKYQVHKVLQKLNFLPLPQKLKTVLSNFIAPTGHQIYKWLKQLDALCINFGAGNIVWSNSGTIDRRRTAELIFRDSKNDVNSCELFFLACSYFLHDDICRLSIDIEQKDMDIKFLLYSISYSNRKFVQFFLGQHKFSLNELRALLIEVSVEAFQFLLLPYTPNERQTILRDSICCMVEKHNHDMEWCNDILDDVICDSVSNKLCVLLPTLNDEERKSLFQKCAEKVLVCFLQYPGQQKFLPMLHEVSEFMSAERYHFVLKHIISKIHLGFADYDYQHLFEMFWQERTVEFKKYRIMRCSQIHLWDFYGVYKITLLELQMIHKFSKDTEIWIELGEYLTNCLQREAENMPIPSLELVTFLLNEVKNADYISEEQSLNFNYEEIVDILTQIVQMVVMSRQQASIS